jgi:hypothetical protein
MLESFRPTFVMTSRTFVVFVWARVAASELSPSCTEAGSIPGARILVMVR